MEKQYAAIGTNLYYLAKGIIKAIPGIGPVLEEVVFNQYEEQLKPKFGDTVKTLTKDEQKLFEQSIETLLQLGPTLSTTIENSFTSVGGDLQNTMFRIEDNLMDSFEEIDTDLETIKGILSEIHRDIGNQEKLKETLLDIERRRIELIEKISHTQRRVLKAIPEEPTLVFTIFERIREEVPSLRDIRAKELHLRLHELRYLGLIDRKKDAKGKWLYWRDISQKFGIDKSE